MNKKQGIALTLATALSTTTVAGCFGGSDTYEILSATGYSSTYEVDDAFLLNNLTIKVRKNGEETTTINVTPDMIDSMPDMTTAGQKTVTIKYRGQEFTFDFTVIDSKQELIDKLANYLKDFHYGSVDSISGNIDVDLIAKFLKDNSEIKHSDGFTLSKSDLENLEGLTQDQQKLIKDLYNSLTNALVESGLTINKDQILSDEKFKISPNLIIDKLMTQLQGKALDYTMQKIMLKEIADSLTQKMCSYLEITDNNVQTQLENHMFTALMGIRNDDKTGTYNGLDSIFGLLTNHEVCTKSDLVKVIEDAYKNIKLNNQDVVISSLVSKILETFNNEIYDSDHNIVTDETAIANKNKYHNAVVKHYRTMERFLSDEISINVLFKTWSTCFNEMAVAAKYFADSEYIFVNDYKTLLINGKNCLVIEAFANLITTLSNGQSNALVIEKCLFVLYTNLYANTSVTIKGSISLVDPQSDESEDEYFQDHINSLDNTIKYLRVLASNDRKQIIEFISELLENEVYINNYNEHGTPYYLKEVASKIEVEGNVTSAHKAAIVNFATYVDEIVLKGHGLDQTLTELSTLFNSLLDAEKAQDNNKARIISVILNSLKPNQTGKEKIKYLINNLPVDIYEVITDYLFKDNLSFGTKLDIYTNIKANIELLLSDNSLNNFNLFNYLTQNIFTVYSSDFDDMLDDKKEEVQEKILVIATSLDKFITEGDIVGVYNAIKSSAPVFAELSDSRSIKLLANIFSVFGFDFESMVQSTSINKYLSNEWLKEDFTKILLTQNFLDLFKLEHNSQNEYFVNQRFTNVILNSIKIGDVYDLSQLKLATVVKSIYDTLPYVNYQYNIDYKNVILKLVDGNGSLFDNFVSIIDSTNDRDSLVEIILEITELKYLSKSEIVRPYVNQLLLTLRNEGVSSKVYDDTLQLMYNLCDDELQRTSVGLIDFAIKTLNEYLSSNGTANFEVISGYIKQLRENHDMSTLFPDAVDHLISILENKVEDVESLVSDLLKNENIFNMCSDTVDYFVMNLLNINENMDRWVLIDIVNQNFSTPVLNNLKEKQPITIRMIGEYLENTVKEIKDNYNNYNLLPGIISAILKFESSANFETNVTNIVKVLVENYNAEDSIKTFISDKIMQLVYIDVDGNALSEADQISFRFFNIITGEDEHVDGFIDELKTFAKKYCKSEEVDLAEVIINNIDTYIVQKIQIQDGYDISRLKIKDLTDCFYRCMEDSGVGYNADLKAIIDEIVDESTSDIFTNIKNVMADENKRETLMEILLPGASFQNEDFYNYCVDSVSTLYIKVFNLEAKINFDDIYEIVKHEFGTPIIENLKNKQTITPRMIGEYILNIEKTSAEQYPEVFGYSKVFEYMVLTLTNYDSSKNDIENLKSNIITLIKNKKEDVCGFIASHITYLSSVGYDDTIGDATALAEKLFDIVMGDDQDVDGLIDQIKTFANTYCISIPNETIEKILTNIDTYIVQKIQIQDSYDISKLKIKDLTDCFYKCMDDLGVGYNADLKAIIDEIVDESISDIFTNIKNVMADENKRETLIGILKNVILDEYDALINNLTFIKIDKSIISTLMDLLTLDSSKFADEEYRISFADKIIASIGVNNEQMQNAIKTLTNDLLKDVADKKVTVISAQRQIMALIKDLFEDDASRFYVTATDKVLNSLLEIINYNENTQTQLKALLEEFLNDESVKNTVPQTVQDILNIITKDELSDKIIVQELLKIEQIYSTVSEKMTNAAMEMFKFRYENANRLKQVVSNEFVTPILNQIKDGTDIDLQYIALKYSSLLQKLSNDEEFKDYIQYNSFTGDFVIQMLNSNDSIENNFKNFINSKNDYLKQEIKSLLNKYAINKDEAKTEDIVQDFLDIVCGRNTNIKEFINDLVEYAKTCFVTDEFESTVLQPYFNIIETEKGYDLTKLSVANVIDLGFDTLKYFKVFEDETAKAIIHDLLDNTSENILDKIAHIMSDTTKKEYVEQLLNYSFGEEVGAKLLEILNSDKDSMHQTIIDQIKQTEYFTEVENALNKIAYDILIKSENMDEAVVNAIIKECFGNVILNDMLNGTMITPKYITQKYLNVVNALKVLYPQDTNKTESIVKFVLSILNEENGSVKNRVSVAVKELLQTNKNDAVGFISDKILQTIEYSPKAHADCNDLANLIIDVMLGDKQEQELIECVNEFVNTYYSKETQTAIYSTTALVAILTNNQNLDYDQIFEFIELPEGISIDYNKLIKKLSENFDYENCIKITDISYTINQNSLKDTFVGTTYNLTIAINFDAEIASVIGEIKLSLNLNV